MTTGQRIAQRRKERNLSQEALGEQLGVSRQSVYKWESDATLPEIDKLIAMSRIFSVSVGWLLGAEEDPAHAPAGETAADGELTEQQVKMVEEIVGRYIAARPEPPKKRRWLWVIGALAVVIVFVNLFDRLDRVNNQYNNLQYSVNNVQNDVNRQIGSIAGRVEEILKSQNNLTADYGTEILSADLVRNTITFRVWATPKTYVEGMSAVFQADAGDGMVEAPGNLGPGREFSAEMTCTLTDGITLTVVFLDGDKGETQRLQQYDGLYSGSFPEVDVEESHLLMWRELDDRGNLRYENDYAFIRESSPVSWVTNASVPVAGIREIRVGLFVNKELVTWLEPCEWPKDRFVGEDWKDYSFYRMPDMTITPRPTDIFSLAAVVVDEYGRERVCESLPRYMAVDGRMEGAGDREMTAATGLTIQAWWDLPWKYE